MSVGDVHADVVGVDRAMRAELRANECSQLFVGEIRDVVGVVEVFSHLASAPRGARGAPVIGRGSTTPRASAPGFSSTGSWPGCSRAPRSRPKRACSTRWDT